MTKPLTRIALLVMGVLSTVAYAGEYNFTPGLWETVSTMKVTGVPEQMAAMMKQPPHTEQHCMSEKDVMFNADQECTYDKNSVSAKNVTFVMSCPTQNGMSKGKGEVNFRGKKVDGWFEMVSDGPTGPMTMRNSFTSKYLGACPK